MSSITTIVSNSGEKATLIQIDSIGFKIKELCLKDADISSLKINEEISKKFEGVKASIEKLDVSKCEKIPEFIAMIGNKLNEAIEVINILKTENEVLKNKIETKVSLQDIDNSLAKIKNTERVRY
ncbi:hypothetical protein [Clostridium perfringens]|uniref:hypothetical protein n=1 Tax=Clostridium perfringens TaxID=1502 RepID=UPI001CAFD3EA|nr:hypothetical protein [Clostridium perfringens]HBI6923283.1 hypothetical protein [Clostridium perfringens]HBI6927344.1 hypothetical protein [Clostridium perfringens]HBI6952919.1 hypothetical protein [Clostridium perfringens]HBI7043276.1 hypothetical protein [Clostridium perfringens]